MASKTSIVQTRPVLEHLFAQGRTRAVIVIYTSWGDEQEQGQKAPSSSPNTQNGKIPGSNARIAL